MESCHKQWLPSPLSGSYVNASYKKKIGKVFEPIQRAHRSGGEESALSGSLGINTLHCSLGNKF